MTVDLATRNQNHLTNLGLGDLFKLSEVLTTTGFLPKAIQTPAQAVAVMLKGQELGIPPMQALSNVAVINGKPVCGAELMLALIYRDHGDLALTILETTTKQCRVAYKRRGGERATFEFTISDAERAGLLKNQTWQQYPAAMLRARCISAVARMAFPDSIGGMYSPEELGARVVVDAEGVVVMADDPPAQSSPLKHSGQVGSSSSTSNEAPKQEPVDDDPLTADRVARDRLMVGFNKLLREADEIGYPVEELNLAEMSNAELLGAGKGLRRRLEDYKAESGADLTDDEAMS